MKIIITTFIFIGLIFNLSGQNFPIGHKQFNFVDPSRNRTIQTEVYYPATSAGDNTPFAAGQFPLIVFGHGFMMSWDAYQWLWDSLVPRGYILAFPRTEGGMSPSHSAFGLDLKFLNDFIKNEGTNSSSFFYQHILGTSAIMGHSMGGGSSVLATSNNTNLTTLVNFAAAETNPSAITAAANVTVPALMFYGTNDGVTPPNNHQIPIYNALSSACKTLIGINGGGHCYFANYNFNCSFGESTTNPQPTITREQQQAIVWQLLLPYFEFTLKNNSSAEQQFYQRLNTLNTITFLRSCLMNHDLALLEFTSPVNGCGLNSNQVISVKIKNNGTNPASGFQVSYVFNNQTPVTETFNGIINPGETITFTFNTTVNAGISGQNYSFLAYTTYLNDQYNYNDTIQINLTNTSVSLPLSVDFTGFNGTNLSTVFPGWKEAQGIVPTGTSSTWVNRTGLGNTNNVTAKVNFYGSPIREWILGPAFLCTPYTYLYFDVAVTAYNSNNAYTNGMGNNDSLRVFYSTDCGNTWKRLTAFGKNSGFTNNLQTKTIPLSQFSGMGIAIAFQAFRETSSANDYDLHIDNILIKNEFPYDLSVNQLINPTIKDCYGNEAISVELKNTGLNTIDFNQEAVLVNVTVNNGQYNENINLSSGTLAPGSTLTVNFPTINMSTQGTYNFNIQLTYNSDLNASNNSLQSSFTVNNPAVSISGDTLICTGNTTQLAATATAYGSVLTSSSNSTPYNIPDNIGNGVFSNITLNTPSNIQASSVLEVIIDSLTHGYVGDLKIELYAPNNSFVTLVNRKGGNGDNFIKTVFTMNATTSIVNGTAPFTGQFQPEQSFSNLTGSANGTWRLKVMDLAPGDVGILHKWTIKILVPNAIVSYTWNNGQNTPTISVSPISTQTYTITVTDMKGCTATSNFTVNVAGQVSSVNLGNDTTICQGQSITLNAGNNFTNYVWNTGQNTQTIQVSQSGTYWVQATNECGTVSDTITITVNPLPNANLNNYTVCANNNLTLSLANNCATYSWSTGATTESIVVPTQVPGNYTYQVTVTDCNGCSNTGISVITVNSNPSVNLGNDTLICQNQTLLLNAGVHNSYIWSDASTSQTILFDASQYPIGTYTYSVTVTNTYGCTATDTIQIITDPCTQNIHTELSTILIYPNPASEYIVIDRAPIGYSICITNSLGQTVLSTSIHKTTEKLSLKELPSGVYFMLIANGLERYTIAFTKQ
ncbi:MAG: proprotein convertase P-domain-containing protein [Bacteroidales bacterium]|nr:proprotein convertase P-domain-containing protein [Bacteroidales bacterium]